VVVPSVRIDITASETPIIQWRLPIWSILPEDCYVVDVSIDYDARNTAHWQANSDITLDILTEGAAADTSRAVLIDTEDMNATVSDTLSVTANGIYSVKTDRPYILLTINALNNTGGIVSLYLSAFTINYRW
jgi:hypothetical protein